MRILVVGAGATGGYFGGRLLEAGRDVVFLLRQERAKTLARTGLNIVSPVGNTAVPSPPVVLAEHLAGAFDLIILSCKAYDLEAAMAALAPAVGPRTAILPLLNGMRHLSILQERFGEATVLGGQCVISSTLAPQGTIVHLNSVHRLTYGERDGDISDRMREIEQAFVGARFEAQLSDRIMQSMWDKWVVLAAMAAATSLMRASVGTICATDGGKAFLLGLIDECASVARAAGHGPSHEEMHGIRAFLTESGSGQTSSMFRDITAGARIEADHIVGDLIARGRSANLATPRLDIAYVHLQAYESNRASLPA